MGKLKKVGIGIGVVFLILIILGIIGSTFFLQSQLYQEKQSQSIIVSYSSAIKNSIDYIGQSTSGGYPYTAQPDSGKIFLVVNMTIKNNGYDKFSVNPFYFHVVVNNIKYDYDSNTYYLADKLGSVDVLNGGKLSGSLVFQIPSSDSSLPFNLTCDVPFASYNITWSKI